MEMVVNTNIEDLNETDNFNKIDKETLKIIVNVCFSDLIGCKIDKEVTINALSKVIPYSLLMEYCSFKVAKAISLKFKGCKGFIYYKEAHVSVDIEEIQNGKYTEYILTGI